MKKYVSLMNFTFFLFVLCAPLKSLSAQPNTFQTFLQNDFLLTSPGAMGYGLYGYENPALLNYSEGFNMLFAWKDHSGKFREFNNWGLFSSISNIGFGMIHRKYSAGTIANYKLSLAVGDRSFSTGLSYGWSNSDIADFNRTDILTLGFLLRPSKYVSAGLNGITALTENSHSIYLDLAIRPLGNELLSIFGDMSIASFYGRKYERNFWSAGAALELIPGLRLTGRYFDTKSFTAGLEIGLGNLTLHSQSHFDKDQKYAFNTYGIRLGSYDRNFTRNFSTKSNNYLNLTLSDVKYRRFRFFDNSSTLFDLLSQINAAKDDPDISGIALNATELSSDREKLWELREAILQFKKSGKKVVIFLERPSLDLYHFASVADKIVLDPQGMILFQGLVTGRTYIKGMLEKIGIGFEEWRFFKYKSAFENLGREKMSDADRQQRQELVDGIYNIIKNDVTRSRKITDDQFDNIVNNLGIIIAPEALELHLVDTLQRWENAGEILKKLEGKDIALTNSIEKFKLPEDNHWGEFNYIAVIYALGNCDMNTGIAARKLVKDVEDVTNNPKIKAVVFRVDSPGGDGMASDYIAEAMLKLKKKKPVIVSQGSVAASGGYWLSMYADTIVAAPNTVTGSIGVIGGWAYNITLKEKLGVTTDYVKRGEHADLGFGATVPFIGLSLPDRNLDAAEKKRMEHIIKAEYNDFVSKVALGRNMTKEYIDSVGQGRVWDGSAGLKNGLVDLLGGLNDAINIAKVKAKISDDKNVKILQYPEMPAFDLSFLKPSILGFDIKEDKIFSDIKFRFEHNGQPLYILPLDYMEFVR
ncbi:MAG: signal peptide peptidase SppA [Bacteroidota bacterium]|nr:signal peptide peptidase SppA [Bacteroidota bacterium]MDP4189947.1 signal peptide peptidase SppA [Bacteroidota bacterium]